MLAAIRAFFASRQVLEVETPLLCQAGVTDPHLQAFTTEYRLPGSLDGMTLYLQTSPEYAMKRLLAAGYGSIFQITKAFRNEESGRQHNPEFTLLEWYRTGFCLSDLITEIDELISSLFTELPPLEPSEVLEYQSIFEFYLGVNPLTATVDEMRTVARRHGLSDAESLCGHSIPEWLDYLFSMRIQAELGQNRLSFVLGYPACLPSLARTRSADIRTVERVEVFLAGMELGNGYDELTDAIEQEIRLKAGLRERIRRGLAQAQPDARLLAALRHGLPDCSGVALGLDRLLMARLGLSSIDETICFPVRVA